jgi:hypothetical protein
MISSSILDQIAVLAIETVLARMALKINKKVLKLTDSRLELVGQVFFWLICLISDR